MWRPPFAASGSAPPSPRSPIFGIGWEEILDMDDYVLEEYW